MQLKGTYFVLSQRIYIYIFLFLSVFAYLMVALSHLLMTLRLGWVLHQENYISLEINWLINTKQNFMIVFNFPISFLLNLNIF